MNLSPLTRQAYNRWITRDTWYTGHSNDIKMFYAFVKAYLSYGRTHIDGRMIKDDILKNYLHSFNPEHLNHYATHYANLFDELIEFHSYLKNSCR